MKPSLSNVSDKKEVSGLQGRPVNPTPKDQVGRIAQATSAIAGNTLISAKTNAIVPGHVNTAGSNQNNARLKKPVKSSGIQEMIAIFENTNQSALEKMPSLMRYKTGKSLIDSGYEPSNKLTRIFATGNIHDPESCDFGSQFTPDVIELTKQYSSAFVDAIEAVLTSDQIHGRGIVENPLQTMNLLKEKACDLYGLDERPELKGHDKVPSGSMAADYTTNSIYYCKNDIVEFKNPKESRTNRLRIISSIFHEITHFWQSKLTTQYFEKKLVKESPQETIAVSSYLGKKGREKLPNEFGGQFKDAKLYAHAWHEQHAHMAQYNLFKTLLTEYKEKVTQADPKPIKYFASIDKMDNTRHFHLVDATRFTQRNP